ncbi:MAG: hypothetical protein R2805_12690 [Flavobacterium sp.]|jgi:hypothetical protein|uniref:hypothetical protein n=1 Tax=Flavobacterium sp. TaxID=239 RepID=UPI002C512568|nr:hypothetical protein [Flavobacterium sp.]MCA0348699.1 hypothetical protein [Bacteroidota bacterium]HQA75236.1 hypothetical protein [Flavobacterium sp.]
MFIIIISAFLSSVILFLTYKIKKEQEDHSIKIKFLQNIINDLLEMNKNQESKVKLSDSLIQNLYNARNNIDQNVFDLQKEIIEKLAANNLLD